MLLNSENEASVRILSLLFTFFLFSSIPIISFAEDFTDGIRAIIIPNHKESIRVFRLSAEEGDKRSQHILGVMLYKGLGVKQSYEEAFKWLKSAAKLGHAQAKLDLAIMIYHKKGIPKNYK
jgi:uncharacterized protein